MDYKKKYKEALERMKSWARGEHPECFSEAQKAAEFIFPELKESEDERIRKAIIYGMSVLKEQYKETFFSIPIDDCIIWLEKQGEQNPTDKIKPKFHEGDWVIYECGEETATLQITRIVGETYVFSDDSTLGVVDEDALRLWDITKDAKDGDVLSNWNNTTFIFKTIEDETVKFHIAYNEKWDEIQIPSTKLSHLGLPEPQFEFYPATKEQREQLEKAMADAGWEFDFERKELKKIKESKLTEFEDAIKDMMDNYRDAIDDNDATVEEVKEKAAYLLSLIPCKPAEWSEEDELSLKQAIYVCHQNGYTAVENWLKSIRPQNRWKPSDEQMEAIRLARSFVTDDFSEHPTLSEILIELEGQLKKLREE